MNDENIKLGTFVKIKGGEHTAIIVGTEVSSNNVPIYLILSKIVSTPFWATSQAFEIIVW